jgi:hypothetical protein
MRAGIAFKVASELTCTNVKALQKHAEACKTHVGQPYVNALLDV